MTRLDHVTTHPLRGNLFENLVIMEWIKQRWIQHLPHNTYFYRDQSHNEIDLVVADGDQLRLVDVKAGQTVVDDYFRGVYAARRTRLSIKKAFVIYDSSERQARRDAEVLPLRELARLDLDLG